MKQRNPLAVFLLSLITLGIYDIYWLVVTKKELNAKTRVKVPTIWLLFAPVLLLVVVTIVLAVMRGGGTSNQSGFAAISLIIDFLAIVLVLPLSFYWFFKFSKSVNEYTSGKMSTGVTFLLMWILHLIGVAIVQDAFNDMLNASAVPAGPAAMNSGDQQGAATFPPAPSSPSVPVDPVPSADAAAPQPPTPPEVAESPSTPPSETPPVV